MTMQSRIVFPFRQHVKRLSSAQLVLHGSRSREEFLLFLNWTCMLWISRSFNVSNGFVPSREFLIFFLPRRGRRVNSGWKRKCFHIAHQPVPAIKKNGKLLKCKQIAWSDESHGSRAHTLWAHKTTSDKMHCRRIVNEVVNETLVKFGFVETVSLVPSQTHGSEDAFHAANESYRCARERPFRGRFFRVKGRSGCQDTQNRLCRGSMNFIASRMRWCLPKYFPRPLETKAFFSKLAELASYFPPRS